MNKDYNIKVFAVIDTNVVISSMMGNKPDTSTKQIMNYIQTENIIPLFDERMLQEYNEVLLRYFTPDVTEDKLLSIINYGLLVTDIKATKELFVDKDDIPFFEVKESTKELDSYLITGNVKHYPENSSVTSSNMIQMMNYMNRFIYPANKESYLKGIVDTINSLKSDKYSSGKKMVSQVMNNLGYNDVKINDIQQRIK